MISSINMIKDCIPYGDARKNNEALEVQFLRSSSPKNPQGLSPFFSASMYLKTQSSTPCAIDANSLDFTFFSRYSMISGDKVTVNDFFLTLSIQESFLRNIIYTPANHSCLTRNIRVGELQYDKSNSLSASSADPGRHRFHPHGMSDELLGPRPRGSVGFSPALPHAGTEEEDAGGDGHLRPPALDGPLGDPREEVTA